MQHGCDTKRAAAAAGRRACAAAIERRRGCFDAVLIETSLCADAAWGTDAYATRGVLLSEIKKRGYTNMIEEHQLYDQAETAALLRVSERALEAWRHRGGGPRFVRLGGGKRGAIRYRGQALLDYLTAAERADTRDEGPSAAGTKPIARGRSEIDPVAIGRAAAAEVAAKCARCRGQPGS